MLAHEGMCCERGEESVFRVVLPANTDSQSILQGKWAYPYGYIGESERNQEVSDQRLGEVLEVESLMKRYCLFFDTKSPRALGDLFTEDARIDYGPEVEPIQGRGKLVAMVENGARTRFESTNHRISNEIVTFTGEAVATGTSHLYAWHKYFDSEVIGHLWGGYRYRFSKENGSWLIASLKLYASGMEGFHRSRMHDFRNILDDTI